MVDSCMELVDGMVKAGNKDLQEVGGMRLVQDRHLGYKALKKENSFITIHCHFCLLYTSPSPRDKRQSRMPSSA